MVVIVDELLILEQIEEGVAVCETPERTKVQFSAGLLPAGTKPGDCLRRAADGSLSVDAEETARRRRRNIDLFGSLRRP